MQILALTLFVMVACFGLYLFIQKKDQQNVSHWMAPMHGLAAMVGLILLVSGVVTEAVNDWSLIALAMFTGLISGAFLLFRKLLKGRPKPLYLIAGHATFAVACIGVLLYSLLIGG